MPSPGKNNTKEIQIIIALIRGFKLKMSTVRKGVAKGKEHKSKISEALKQYWDKKRMRQCQI